MCLIRPMVFPSSIINHQSSIINHHSSLITHHSSLINHQSSIATRHSPLSVPSRLLDGLKTKEQTPIEKKPKGIIVTGVARLQLRDVSFPVAV